MMLFYAQEPLGGLRTTPNRAFLGFPECTKRIKPIEDLFSDSFIIIHLFIWTYLAV